MNRTTTLPDAAPRSPRRSMLASVVALLLATLLMAAAGDATGPDLYINGMRATGLRGAEMVHCTVKIDADGNLHITVRVKDVINRGGIKINPVDIETLIDRHPAVLMSAIAPIPDEVLGEKACLYVQLRPDAGLTLAEACGWLKDHDVAKMKWPEALVIVDQMPLTPTRKIVKGALRPPDPVG